MAVAVVTDGSRLVDPACQFFRWSEFSGWQLADAVRAARARSLVQQILCPARRGFGPLRLTSWYAWSNGSPREGTHGEGAAIDLVPALDNTRERRRALYTWLRDHVYFGELLLEEYATGGPHVHVTLPGFGGNLEALLQQPGGGFQVDPDAPMLGDVEVRAGLDTPGGMLLIAGIAVGLWNRREK